MTRRRGKRRGGTPWGALVAGALVLGALPMANYLRASPISEGPSGACDSRWQGPTTAIVVDASNDLAPRSRDSVREAINRAVIERRGARIVIARVSGAEAYSPQFLFDRCDPGGASEATFNEGPLAREDERRTAFLEPLGEAIRSLFDTVPPNRESFISSTIQRVASDPAMHLDSQGSTLVFVSDMIESSRISKPYETGTIELPPVEEPFLSGIAVRVIELPGIPGATMLQTHTSRDRWRLWFEAAGARDIKLSFPGLFQPSSNAVYGM